MATSGSPNIYPEEGTKLLIRYVPGRYEQAFALITGYEIGFQDEDAHLRQMHLKAVASIDSQNSTDASTRILINVQYKMSDNDSYLSLDPDSLLLKADILLVIPEEGD
jgi:hypothetical protein